VPTAVQALGEVQETSSSRTPFAPLGVGTLWGVQLEPFQDSASGDPSPEVLSYQPTATQVLAEVQETPPSPLDFAPLGVGTLWSVQLSAAAPLGDAHASARPASARANAKARRRAHWPPAPRMGLVRVRVDAAASRMGAAASIARPDESPVVGNALIVGADASGHRIAPFIRHAFPTQV
jgi:hypothetical protein